MAKATSSTLINSTPLLICFRCYAKSSCLDVELLCLTKTISPKNNKTQSAESSAVLTDWHCRHNIERSIPHILTQQLASTTSPLLHSGTNTKIWHKSNCQRHSRVQLIHWWRWFNQWNVFISGCCKIYELQIPVCVSIFRYYLPNFILDYHISQQQTQPSKMMSYLSIKHLHFFYQNPEFFSHFSWAYFFMFNCVLLVES